MGLSASQTRFLLLTAKRSDLEFRAQQISQRRLILAQELESISTDYENATSNRVMTIRLYDQVSDGKNTVVEKNLTYKNLVAGAMKQGYLKNVDSDIDLATNAAYRVKDAQGRIVVSDESEIPTSRTVFNTYNMNELANENGIYNDNGTVYLINHNFTGDTDAYGNTYYENRDCYYATDDSGTYVKVPQYPDNPNTGFWFYQLNKNKNNNEFDTMVSIKNENLPENLNWQSINIISPEDAKAKMFNFTETEQLTQTKSGDTITLRDSKGNAIQTYIVDSALATNDAGPSYFQDCIRNGKYIIEKHSGSEADDTAKWSSISFDTITEITDSYYTADDANAEAKYKRLQNEVQNQDKKLELELDNIETQRSAVTTEVESVQKVIDDNVESTFKTFA